jgi:hypothetical protein
MKEQWDEVNVIKRVFFSGVSVEEVLLGKPSIYVS